MDFVDIATGPNGSVTFSVDWEAMMNAFSPLEWVVIAIALNVIYGLMVHAWSLWRISRWNKLAGREYRRQVERSHDKNHPYPNPYLKPLEGWGLFPLLFWRTTLNLPVRIITFILGLFGMGLLFVSSGKIRRNGLLRWGWHASARPYQIRAIYERGLGAIGSSHWENSPEIG